RAARYSDRGAARSDDPRPGTRKMERVERALAVAGSLEVAPVRARLPAPPKATRPGKGEQRAPRRRYAVRERATRDPEEWDTLIDSPGPLREVASI
ncbi:MAG: hypothetical protein KC503_45130, partial [Myxococcales bacterium]|nr:hypothetical protein [Myxococcales bacterium]